MLPRYARQVRLPELGEAGQQRLLNASAVIIGAGGLGSPVAMYLAAAGVGRIGLVDFDVVDETNLHRQRLYGVEDVGRPKVEAAREPADLWFEAGEVLRRVQSGGDTLAPALGLRQRLRD